RAGAPGVRRVAVSRLASDVPVLDHGGGDPGGDADDGAEGEPVPDVPDCPADQRARDDARRGEPDEHAAGAGEGETGALGLHRRGAYLVTRVFAESSGGTVPL